MTVDWPARYIQRDKEREAQELTARNGPSIFRTQAEKKYKLAARDLDSILPIYRNKNPHGGIGDVRLYNVCDVKDLVIRLGPILGPNELTESDGGPEIEDIEAAKRYKLELCQLQRIKPIKAVPRITKAGRPGYTRTYNASDVEALHDRVEAAAAAPVGVPIPRPEEENDEDTFKVEGADDEKKIKKEEVVDEKIVKQEEAVDEMIVKQEEAIERL